MTPTDPFRLETERLVLLPFRAADLEALEALFNDPQVGFFLFDGEPVPCETVEAEIAASEQAFARDGWGLWGAWLREDGSLAGFVGYRPFFDPPELQLLYALAPRAWGRGLAQEGARAVLRHGFERLGFAEVRAATDPPNEASIRVLERLGFTLLDRSDRNGHDTLTYRLQRQDGEDREGNVPAPSSAVGT